MSEETGTESETETECTHEEIELVGSAQGYAPDLVIDVCCRLCGKSGSLLINPTDVLW